MGPKAAKAGAHAMIDISDGLVADLGHIAAASKVTIDLDRELLPQPQFLVHLASAMGEDPLEWVLHGGEDHALVAVFPKTVNIPKGFAPIGVVKRRTSASQSEPFVTLNGREITGKPGHDHFS
jgi:thiamine-monophosphate kinase